MIKQVPPRISSVIKGGINESEANINDQLRAFLNLPTPSPADLASLVKQIDVIRLRGFPALPELDALIMSAQNLLTLTDSSFQVAMHLFKDEVKKYLAMVTQDLPVDKWLETATFDPATN